MKTGELLKQLATRAGIDLTKAEIVKLVALTDELPDDDANVFLNNLFNEASAKNHAGIKSHFTHSALSGVDAEIERVATEYELSDADKAEILAEKSTSKKTRLLTSKVKAAMEADFAAKGGDKSQLIKDVQKLNADIVTIRTEAENKVKQAQAAAEGEITNYAVDSYLRSQPWVNKEIDASVNSITGRTLIENELKSKGAKLVRKDGALKLIKSDNPDLDYTENNQPVKFEDFSNKILANNKLLAVTSTESRQAAPPRREAANGDRKVVDTTKAANGLREMAEKAKAQMV